MGANRSRPMSNHYQVALISGQLTTTPPRGSAWVASDRSRFTVRRREMSSFEYGFGQRGTNQKTVQQTAACIPRCIP